MYIKSALDNRSFIKKDELFWFS